METKQHNQPQSQRPTSQEAKPSLQQTGLISIIVPCYNVAKYLDDCFLSLENQTYKNIEVIFVNDGSTDDTLQKLKNFCAGKTNCKIVDQKNKGLSGARNSGVSVAEGEFLYFYDPDDCMRPAILERLVSLISQQKDGKTFACSICRYEQVPEEFQFQDTKESPKQKVEIVKGTKKILKQYITFSKFGHAVWTNLYRHEVIKKMSNYPNVFDENIKLGEDVDFNFRFFCLIEEVVFTKEVLYEYRQRSKSLMHENFSIKKLDPLKSFDNALACCKGKLKSVGYVVNLCKFDKYNRILSEIIRARFSDASVLKVLLKGYKRSIYKTYIPFLFFVYFYFRLRLFAVMKKNRGCEQNG